MGAVTTGARMAHAQLAALEAAGTLDGQRGDADAAVRPGVTVPLDELLAEGDAPGG